jgi:hypothetical protein
MVVVGFGLGITCFVMGDKPSYIIILIFFSLFMMFYSFGSALFQG